ncbi:MAG: DUF3800 domain-containing protein [Oscillospiraceae bacterium]|nr:DUF3800 domain-containing protein [Oscillospiraceae bacterium]
MNIFVFSDESGTLDKVHNDFFVFGGLIFLSKDDKDINTRKFIKAEKDIRTSGGYALDVELKASRLRNDEKGKLYRSLNQCIKFGAVVQQKEVLKNIFSHKKDKQRYLDYIFKISLKRSFEELMRRGIIINKEVENIYAYVDEHTTATNGLYELREALEQEYKRGTYNLNYNAFYPPIFTGLKSVNLKYCNSKAVHLVRAADIIANRIFYYAKINSFPDDNNLIITHFP